MELKVGDTFTAKTTFDGRIEVISINTETNELKVKLTNWEVPYNGDPRYVKSWPEIWNLRNTLPVFDEGEYFLSETFPEEFPPKDFEN